MCVRVCVSAYECVFEFVTYPARRRDYVMQGYHCIFMGFQGSGWVLWGVLDCPLSTPPRTFSAGVGKWRCFFLLGGGGLVWGGDFEGYVCGYSSCSEVSACLL